MVLGKEQAETGDELFNNKSNLDTRAILQTRQFLLSTRSTTDRGNPVDSPVQNPCFHEGACM